MGKGHKELGKIFFCIALGVRANTELSSLLFVSVVSRDFKMLVTDQF